MLVETIIANALDLAGGNLVRSALDADAAALACLNVIDAMMLELSAAGKQISGVKANITLAANVQTGTVNLSALGLDAKFVRYRVPGQTTGWNLIEVFDDIEDLTRAENDCRKGIVFQGLDRASTTYFLSWIPLEAIAAEVWGRQISAELVSLAALPPFPAEFSLLCAYRTADFVLNQLLLIDDRKFGNFVIAQKGSIRGEMLRLSNIWDIYKEKPAGADNVSRVRPFDVFADMEDEPVDYGIFY